MMFNTFMKYLVRVCISLSLLMHAALLGKKIVLSAGLTFGFEAFAIFGYFLGAIAIILWGIE